MPTSVPGFDLGIDPFRTVNDPVALAKILAEATSIIVQLADAAGDLDDISDGTATVKMTVAEQTKLAGIEALADVTDTANVTAAGALMDSEVDSDIQTLALPANTTISTFSASLVDDTSADAARATLGVEETLVWLGW